MTHWTDRLRDADEALARELSAEEAQRLKRTVLGASAAAQARRWSLPFALTAGSLAAASAALVLTTVAASQRSQTTGAVERAAAAEELIDGQPTDSGPRQLHFATPGGTRIIWVFDADFEVKGTLP